jgi:hypothetical protein
VLAALAWGLFAPASSHASCGDYVIIGGEHSTPAAPSTHQFAPSFPEPPADLPAAPAPCHGPRCSAPAPTPLTVTPVPVLHLEEWAAVSGLGPFLPGAARSSPPLDERTRPRHRPGTVFRPPRCSSVVQSA